MAVLGPFFLFFVIFFPRNILLCKCTTVHLKEIEKADALDTHLHHLRRTPEGIFSSLLH